MKYLSFIATYLFVFSSIFVDQEYFVFYFIVFGFYSALFYDTKSEIYRTALVDPAVLSLLSGTIVLFLHGMNTLEHAVFFSIVPYLVIVLKGKKENEHKVQSELLFIIEKLIMPLTLPITLCFIISLMIKSELIASISFVLVYFVLINNMLRGTPSIKYSGIILIIQNIIMVYLYEYIYFIDHFEKLMLGVAINTIIMVNMYRRGLKFSIRSKSLLKKNTNITKL